MQTTQSFSNGSLLYHTRKKQQPGRSNTCRSNHACTPVTVKTAAGHCTYLEVAHITHLPPSPRCQDSGYKIVAKANLYRNAHYFSPATANANALVVHVCTLLVSSCFCRKLSSIIRDNAASILSCMPHFKHHSNIKFQVMQLKSKTT